MRWIGSVIVLQLFLTVQGQGSNTCTSEKSMRISTRIANYTLDRVHEHDRELVARSINLTKNVVILMTEVSIIKKRQVLDAFLSGLQLAIVLISILIVSIKNLVECVNEREEKALEENLLEMESRLEERERKSRADRRKMSPSKE